jgi:FkbM family methyltransferase
MNKYSGTVRKAVRFFRAEKLILLFTPFMPILKKLLPIHLEYPENTNQLVRRDGVLFNLDISDYMQWSVFIKDQDYSWQIASENIRENTVILDIGANVGQFSLKLAKYIAKRHFTRIDIFSFEPNPVIYDFLKRNILLNQPDSSTITPVQAALSDDNKQISFIYSLRNSGAGRFTDKTKELLSVRAYSVDSFYNSLRTTKKVSFIKIDVEGFEPEVFNGAWQIIDKQRPVIYFEFTPPWYKERKVDAFTILEKLKEFKYSFYYEDSAKMSLLGDFKILNSVYQTNILAISQTTNS